MGTREPSGDDRSTTQLPSRDPHPRSASAVPCLEGLSGSVRGRTLQLTEAETELGRASDCAIRIEDHGVSRRHAKVSIQPDGIITVRDLASTNGTYVNGAPIDVVVLREGDRIRIGPEVTLRLEYVDQTARVRDTPTAPPSQDPQFNLRPRERDVAVLVAEGLTSKEIADRLGISAGTVNTHLRNIYERLGISSRAALARLVVEQRLSAEA